MRHVHARIRRKHLPLAVSAFIAMVTQKLSTEETLPEAFRSWKT